MVNLLLAFILASIFLLLAAGTVTVRLVYIDEPVIVFDFLLFQIQLFPSRKRKKRSLTKRADNENKIKKRYKNARATKKALDFLLKHSDVNIRAMKIRAEERDPAKLTVYNGYIDSIICALITYLRIKSLGFKNNNPPFSNPPLPDSENPSIDITLHTSLHVVAFTFITYKKDKKRKWERKIVGNKNE